jgi:hypothetical protein
VSAPLIISAVILLLLPDKIPYLSVLVFIPAAFALSIYIGIAVSIGKINLVLKLTLFVSLIKILFLMITQLNQAQTWQFLFLLSTLPYFSLIFAEKKILRIKRFYVTKNLRSAINLSFLGFVFWVGTGLDAILVRFVFNSSEAGVYMISATIGRTVLFVYLYFVQSEYPRMTFDKPYRNLKKLYLNGISLLVSSAVFLILFGNTIAVNLLDKNLPTFASFTSLYILSLSPLVYVLPQLQLLGIFKAFSITPLLFALLCMTLVAFFIFTQSFYSCLIILFASNMAYAFMIWGFKKFNPNTRTKLGT